ncbi:MAG TPA: hypothetical protein ENI72_03320 [Rhodospirillales bacterium]|nr:hypothetical protein [Rhodospirillales bacterium]
MWSSKLKISCLMGALLFLGACGFRPLYGQSGGQTALSDLSSIRIEPIADRLGQELHNNLLDLLTPQGRPQKPRYSLKIKLSQSKKTLAVQKSAFATRANLIIRAVFSLSAVGVGAAATEEVLLSGESSIISSYNILDSDFATVIAERNARTQAVRELADNIRIRLAVYFTQNLQRTPSPKP